MVRGHAHPRKPALSKSTGKATARARAPWGNEPNSRPRQPRHRDARDGKKKKKSRSRGFFRPPRGHGFLRPISRGRSRRRRGRSRRTPCPGRLVDRFPHRHTARAPRLLLYRDKSGLVVASRGREPIASLLSVAASVAASRTSESGRPLPAMLTGLFVTAPTSKYYSRS